MTTIDELQELIRHFFMDDAIAIRTSTTASDVIGWDSLTNITLMLAVERHFGVKFTSREIEAFKNVGDLANTVDVKRSVR